MIAVPGTTYSSVAAQYGVSVQAVEADNPYPATDIPVGAVINVPGGDYAAWTPTTSEKTIQSSDQDSSVPTPSGTSPGISSPSTTGYQIPGLSTSLSNCIAFRESTDGEASSNVFQIMPSSGYTVYPGESLQQQEATAGEIVATQGPSAWASDGCPGT